MAASLEEKRSSAKIIGVGDPSLALGWKTWSLTLTVPPDEMMRICPPKDMGARL